MKLTYTKVDPTKFAVFILAITGTIVLAGLKIVDGASAMGLLGTAIGYVAGNGHGIVVGQEMAKKDGGSV